MEVCLHAVAGTQGSKGGFMLEVDRVIALVNKTMDNLKDEYLIPAAWRVEKNIRVWFNKKVELGR